MTKLKTIFLYFIWALICMGSMFAITLLGILIDLWIFDKPTPVSFIFMLSSFFISSYLGVAFRKKYGVYWSFNDSLKPKNE